MKKSIIRKLIPGVLVVVASSISLSCTWMQRSLVSFFSMDVEPQPDAAAAVASAASDIPNEQRLQLRKVAGGFGNITDIQFIPAVDPGKDHQLVVLAKNGTAYSVRIHEQSGTWVVDSKSTLFQVSVDTDSELGLLGLAFHPDFDLKSEKNRRFFVHHNPRSDLSRISEWEWRTSGAVEKRILFEVAQPYQNHNGGGLAFGPDGRLYAGLGDGGWRGDPKNLAQDKRSFLGKMLRFDVDRQMTGRIEPEVFASGLRNPWRFSFDSKGRLIAGDVGQDEWEEITFVPQGANLGWRVMEASHCYDPAKDCQGLARSFTGPFVEYDHSIGKSVTGGFEYSGSLMPEFRGRYFFGDFVSGRIWSVPIPEVNPNQPISQNNMMAHGQWDVLISTFARDRRGEIYLGDYRSGAVYQITR